MLSRPPPATLSRMACKLRNIQGGLVYHVINRASARAAIFRKQADYAAFERTLAEAHARIPMRILTYVLMPNHFHLILWPRRGQGETLSEFMRWLQVTHTQRWHAHHHTAGTGHLYQGRFKALPVQADGGGGAGGHLRRVCRYVERNPLRAKLCRHAQDWPWSGLWRRIHGTPEERKLLADWPEGTMPRADIWLKLVNKPEAPADLAALRESIRRGQPLGDAPWALAKARALDLEHTLRPRGRPRKMLNEKNS